MDGPIVLFWYPTGGSPNSATSSLGTAGINRIINAGGIVAAPTHINSGTFPWIGGGDVDIRLTDEILACAKASSGPGFDSRRIHSLGFSAGALFTTTLSYQRSSYFASVATYSGGGTGTFQENNNKFAAMILHGGPSDSVAGANFQTLSQNWLNSLRNAQHFAFICNHNGGHTIPQGGPASVVQFFFDHPYGTNPSPYAGGFPSGFLSTCSL
jgi:predicted esterase